VSLAIDDELSEDGAVGSGRGGSSDPPLGRPLLDQKIVLDRLRIVNNKGEWKKIDERYEGCE
jgi:hypothetical protein